MNHSPNHHERVQVLKKLALVALLGWIGFLVGLVVVGIYLEPSSAFSSGVWPLKFGMPAFANSISGGILGSACGVMLGATIIRRVPRFSLRTLAIAFVV